MFLLVFFKEKAVFIYLHMHKIEILIIFVSYKLNQYLNTGKRYTVVALFSFLKSPLDYENASKLMLHVPTVYSRVFLRYVESTEW